MSNPILERRPDGTVSALRKKTVYTELYFYKRSDVLVQLTKAFCERFLPKYGDRTVDQMVQAARSIKQNIAEGCTDGQTSFETEIKLLGIARGSNKELLEDYMDYLKHNQLSEWATSNTERYNRLRTFAKEHTETSDYAPYFQRWTAEEMANCAICLCHMVDRAMCTYIGNRDREFVEQGGIRERMTAARLEQRQSQKELIDQLKRENQKLKDQIARLKAKLGE